MAIEEWLFSDSSALGVELEKKSVNNSAWYARQ